MAGSSSTLLVWRAPAVVALALTAAMVVASAPAAAEGDDDLVPRSRVYVSNETLASQIEYDMYLGTPGDTIVTGDWNGDGRSGFGSRVANVFTLRNATGVLFGVASYGKATDDIIVGDWNGDGIDTFGVRRANVFFLRNSLSSGPAEIVFAFGQARDEVHVGDWDGDGIDTFAVRRGNTFYVRKTPTTGVADYVFGFGQAADDILVGDWDRDEIDTFAVRRGQRLFLRNDFRTGVAEREFDFGEATDDIVVGDFAGTGADSFAARRIEPGPPVDAGGLLPGTFATAGPIELVLPASTVHLIGFHQSGREGAVDMTTVPLAISTVVMPTRYRGTGSQTAADIAVDPTAQIRSPVSGTVVRAETYTLYCTYSDDFVWIEPDDRPGWLVKVLHIDGVEVTVGAHVEAGITRLAPRATLFPFESQIDEFTAPIVGPHVHIEVVDPSIPDDLPVSC